MLFRVSYASRPRHAARFLMPASFTRCPPPTPPRLRVFQVACASSFCAVRSAAAGLLALRDAFVACAPRRERAAELAAATRELYAMLCFRTCFRRHRDAARRRSERSALPQPLR